MNSTPTEHLSIVLAFILLIFPLVFVTGCQNGQQVSNEIVKVDESDDTRLRISEPIRYPEFKTSNKRGAEFEVGIVADPQDASGRIITFNPPQLMGDINLKSLSENAISRSQDGTLKKSRQKDVIPAETECWISTEVNFELCALPNAPLSDGRISVVRIWAR